MLKNTFCHIPGIGARKERWLWASGIFSWADLKDGPGETLPHWAQGIMDHVERSISCLQGGEPGYFAELLAPAQAWRLFPDFRCSTAYLDIETSGLGDYITTIALYDGESIHYYVNGENLEDFKQDIKNYNVIVTYNGRCFDVPMIERHLNIKMPQAHIDLRYILKSLGFTGGLKGCERQLGIYREDLDGVDGYFAVLLWEDFKKNRNKRSLETLLAYNILDAVNLEALMVITYNLRLKGTPFFSTNRLDTPLIPSSPFKADRETINRISYERCLKAGRTHRLQAF